MTDWTAVHRQVTYRFKEDARLRRRLQDGLQTGFIAQEVEELLPDAVHTDKHGVKYVAYGKVVPVLVEGVKELYERVQAVEALSGGGSDSGSESGDEGSTVVQIMERVVSIQAENALLKKQLAAQEARLQHLERLLLTKS
jgi:hypothetical protein